MRKLPLLQLYIRAKSFNRGIMAPSLIKLYLYSFIPFRLVITPWLGFWSPDNKFISNEISS